MVKNGIFGMLAAIVLLAGPALSQDGKSPCPRTQTIKGKYCTTCSKLVEENGTQDGKCKLDATRLRTVQVCVRESGNAVILQVCRGCKARTPFREDLVDVKHEAGCSKKEFWSICEH